ncbi:MAG: response regulator [Bdellovibrionia bacterium]
MVTAELKSDFSPYDKVNILLVDDQPRNLLALESILGDLNQNLVKVSSGKEALRCLLRQDFALIVLDVQMPIMDGLETAEFIRNREKTRNLPIIFLTAEELNKTQMLKGYVIGAVDYLNKPVLPEILKAKVSVFVELHKKTIVVKRQAQLLESQRTDLENAMAQVRRESQFKSEFLANMSHEIRTPINGVIGMTDLIIDTPLNTEQRSYADHLKRSAEMLLTLINDILDVSKVEAGKLDLENVAFDLSQVLSDIEKTMALPAQKKGIRLLFEMPADPLSWVKGDPSRLRQILTNLLSNSIKFTATGQVVLRTSKISEATDHSEIKFEVIDTGIGIPEETLKRMFQAFSQADSTTTRKYGGTGLGLYICKKLSDLMGGKIGVESRMGKGSTFWLTLPFGHVAMENQKPELIVEVAEPKKSKNIRILVAEDNTINQMIIQIMLQKLGYRVNVVADGSEAIKALSEIPYDLVLMDCQMPELDGYEATRQIRNSSVVKRQDIPIIAMTANALKGDREKCLESGMNDYVSKPIKSAALLQIIEKWLQSRSS